jgi:hypothetical protein
MNDGANNGAMADLMPFGHVYAKEVLQQHSQVVSGYFREGEVPVPSLPQ